MADVLLPRLNIKVGTKAQYEANKSSLDASNTLVLTPFSEMFTSNTSNDGKGHFSVNGVQVNTLKGSAGSNTANALQPVYLSSDTITALTNSSGANNRPVYVNAGKITPIGTGSDIGAVGSATVASKPVYLTSTGVITACFNTIPVDQSVSSSTYYPIYMANDTTAGAIDKINFAAQATYSFNPSTKKWKYTTTDGTALDFGITKVATW